MKEGSKDVDRLLEKSEPDMRGLAQQFREVIKRTLPGVEELVKWGSPTYLVDGKNVAWILLYKDHVNLGFFQGAKLKSKRLEGTGKGLRHIKVRREEDVDEKEFAPLLKEAVSMTG